MRITSSVLIVAINTIACISTTHGISLRHKSSRVLTTQHFYPIRGNLDHLQLFCPSFIRSVGANGGITSHRFSASNNNDETDDRINIGFLGCGKIATSIVCGLANSKYGNNIKRITVTARSKARSTSLNNSFPRLVKVIEDDDNLQEVVQDSDIIFLCVLPDQVSEVLKRVSFDPQKQVLISLVSTCNIDSLIELSKLPKDRVVKMICLPNVSRCQGLCLLTPPINFISGDITLKDLFEALGGFIECKNERLLQTMMVITGLMGPMYGILKTNADWLVEQGVPTEDASYFVAQIYKDMLQDATATGASFDDLIQEQTPGGVNEQALENLKTLGLVQSYRATMNAMLSRIAGLSDGWIRNSADIIE